MARCSACGLSEQDAGPNCVNCGAALPNALPLDQLATRVFVGRDEELRLLQNGLAEASAGHGQMFLLVGEPGIGKTRTAEEMAQHARLGGCEVFWGRCWESEGAPPFWPWVQALRAVTRSVPQDQLQEWFDAEAAVAQTLPEVQRWLEDVGESPSLDAPMARFRLFDRVTTFLKHAARRAPFMLVLDDIQWADKPSLLLLEFLARELPDAGILVVAAYRDVEVGRHHPLAETLAELSRQAVCRRIGLRGLTLEHVGRFIEASTGVAPPQRLVSTVFEQTEGNPFFINEIVRLLVAERRIERGRSVAPTQLEVPQSVRQVIGKRLDRLSERCNHMLTVASVAGREFDISLLRALADLPERELFEVLDEAEAARVIQSDQDNRARYAFSHALVRETLEAELSTMRRSALHRRVAHELELLYASDLEHHLAELAYHFSEAAPLGDADRAVDFARRAAERAVSRVAYEEGVRLYELALQALEVSNSPNESMRCDILLALGRAMNRSGDSGNAKAVFERASRLAHDLSSPERLARAALDYGGSGFEAGSVDARLLELLGEALGALGESESVLRARLLARFGRESFFSEEDLDPAAIVRSALTMARRLGDAETLAYSLTSLHVVLAAPEFTNERIVIADEILAFAAQLRDPELELQGRHSKLRDLLEMGDMSATRDEVARHGALAAELRQPYYLWQAATFRAMLAFLDGRLEQAEQLAQEALLMGVRGQAPNALQAFGIQIAMLRREQQRMHELEPGLKEFVKQYGSVRAWHAGLAFVHMHMGELERARDELVSIMEDDFTELKKDPQYLPALIYLAEVAAQFDDDKHSVLLYELLLPYAGRTVIIGDAVACAGAADHYLGDLATVLGRLDDAEGHFEAAIRINAAIGPPLLAYSKERYGRMLLRRGDGESRRRALTLLGEVVESASAIGMRALLESALVLEASARERAVPEGATSIDVIADAVERERPDLGVHLAADGGITILFTDIEDSTPMLERLGDDAWLELIRRHNAIVRAEIANHGGIEVKSAGDGFMVVFTSPHQALLCAVAIQRALTRHNEMHEGDEMLVRIGVHTGPSIREGRDFFGRNVVLAARVASAARGGEILVSERVKEMTEAARFFTFGEPRPAYLKGLRGTQSVAALVWQDEVADTLPLHRKHSSRDRERESG